METNNKLREALKDIGRLVEQIHFLYSDYPSEIHEIARKVNAALAEPVKNCDALTADERTHKFIEKWEKAHGESMDGKTIIYLSSFSRWLQLPRKGEMKARAIYGTYVQVTPDDFAKRLITREVELPDDFLTPDGMKNVEFIGISFDNDYQKESKAAK